VKESLAEQLLGIELDWDTPTAKEEIGKLRYLAAVKYDNYRNFGPGKRFMESLILWLRQFKTIEERRIAYGFVMSRMLYISEAQMDHLVDLLYPQRVIPRLLERTGEKENLPLYQRKRIRTSETFKILKRKTLFLGMSDGARMDAFRRKHALNNEQVSVSFYLDSGKWESMQKELEKWLAKKEIKSEAAFENIFLIDDFSGSGKTIINRLEKFVDGYLGTYKEPGKLGKLCIEGGPKIFVVTYLSTENALSQLREHIETFPQREEQPYFASCKILPPLQLLVDSLKVPQLDNNDDRAFDQLLSNYYDESLDDEYTGTGGKDVKYGYAGCALPLVLCHNCPNNSVYLLWGETDKTEKKSGLKALFPRIARHSEGR
jgi:hypothetical protein